MNNRDFNKIGIVSLCDSYTKQLGKLLSQNLDMMFCDTKDLIEYELIDRNAIQALCSKEYLEASERKVIDHIASFVNVVVAISYDYLIHNVDILKENSLIVYVKLSKKYVKENANVINFISYDDRTKTLEGLADLTLMLKKQDLDFVCQKLIEKLGGCL